MLIKICGLSNIVDARLACHEGADALGFVMGGRILPVEVEPHAQHLRPVIKALGRSARTFLVTHFLDPDEILELSRYLGVSGIQISEPLETVKLAKLRNKFKGEIIKTVVASGEESFQELVRIEPYCDYVLLDSCVAGYIGGTGSISNWALCKRLITTSNKQVFLAGGLNPENVKQAIEETAAAGADVSTGVSCFGPDYLRKDRKDPEKIHNFIQAVRRIEK